MAEIPDYESFVQSFLHPDGRNSPELTESITDIIAGYSASDSLDPYAGNPEHDYSFLAQYEEIPEYPINPKAVRQVGAEILSGSVRRHSPSVLQNIITPPAIDTVAVATLANVLKGNMMWDFNSAGAQEAEQQIVRQISRLFGWASGSDGVFTYGGKGCLTYAVRAGLNRCVPNYASTGLAGTGNTPVVVTSEDNHFTIESICSLLGLGSKSCVRITTHSDQTINMVAYEKKIRLLLDKNIPIACVIASGGNTNNLNVDPIREMKSVLTRLAGEYNLPYTPFLYADTVVGWAWLFYKDYDFHKNPLAIGSTVLKRLQRAARLLSDAQVADAAGIDFHKIGFAPYSASLIVMRRKEELHSLFSDAAVTHERQAFGKNFPHSYTMELSRSTAPVLSAWTALQTVGRRGFQMYLAQMITMSDIFREVLPKYGIEWVNTSSLNHMSIFYPVPPAGPGTYNELLRSTAEETTAAKQYAYNFFQYLADSSQGNPIAVRFQLNYTSCANRLSCSMLCVCPAAPHTDAKTALKIAHMIGEKKLAFDAQQDAWKMTALPYAVHK